MYVSYSTRVDDRTDTDTHPLPWSCTRRQQYAYRTDTAQELLCTCSLFRILKERLFRCFHPLSRSWTSTRPRSFTVFVYPYGRTDGIRRASGGKGILIFLVLQIHGLDERLLVSYLGVHNSGSGRIRILLQFTVFEKPGSTKRIRCITSCIVTHRPDPDTRTEKKKNGTCQKKKNTEVLGG